MNKMKKTWIKMLAVSLCLCILFGAVPVEGFAAADDGVAESEEDSGRRADAMILRELTDLREEKVKHFEMSDGTVRAVSYDTAVHYEKNGEWVDIDNTLTTDQSDSVLGYVNVGNGLQIKLSGTSEADYLMKLTSGAYSLSFRAATTDQASERASAGERAFSTEATTTRQPQNVGLKIYDKASGTYRAAAEMNAAAAGSAAKAAAEPNTAAASESAIPAEESVPYNPDFSLKNTVSAAVYEGLFDHVNLEYVLQGNTLKENIVVTERLDSYAFDFSIDAPGLVLRLLEDGSVAAFPEGAAKNGTAPEEADAAVFVIPVPFMYDAGANVSSAVHFELREGADGCWLLRTAADAAWINDADRAFPVVIDPAIQTEQDEKQIRSSYVSSAYPTSAMNTTVWMEVGRYHDGQNTTTSRGFIDITLPTLDPGCVPIGGYLNLFYTTSFSDTSAKREVDLYELTSAYHSDTTTWNAQPSSSANATDYHIVQNTGDNNYVWGSFDITGVIQKWYLNPASKYGFMLKAKDEGVSSSQHFAAKFLRGRLSAYVGGLTRECFPYFTIAYRNTNGAEDYWTFTSIDAGRSGSASVNHFSGNFMMVQPICGVSGNILPVSISMVYNSGNEIGSNGITSVSDSGIGWRTNYNVAVYCSGIEHYMYYFIDSDGTKHYFYSAESGAYYTGTSEDGLGYTFTRYDSPQNDGGDIYYYQIEDKDGGKMLFNGPGNLIKIKDTNGHSIRVEYESLASPKKERISRVLDGVGRAYTFQYGDSANAARITGITDPAGRMATLSYVGDLLWKVTFSDNQYVEFAYNSGDTVTPMSCIDRHDGTRALITYHAGGTRAASLSWGTSGATNIQYTFDYKANETDITDLSGRTVTYQFNSYGQTTGIIDRTSGLAEYYEQGAPGLLPAGNTVNPTANKTTKVSKVQQSNVNFVQNSGFDSSTISTSYTVEDSGTSKTMGWNSKGNIGTGSAKITRSSAVSSGYTYYTQDLGTLAAGNYTFTGYVHTAGATLSGTGAALRLETWSGTTVTGAASSAKVTSTGSSEWKKVSVSIQLPAGQRLKALIGYDDGATWGTAYFDDLQVEYGQTADSRNLLPNSGFVNDSAYWSSTWGGGFSDYSESDGLPGGGRGFCLPGSAGESRRVYSNYIYVSGKKGDVYSFGGWAKGFSAPVNDLNRLDLESSSAVYKPTFELQLEFYNGTTKVGDTVTAAFNSTSNAWQFIGAEAIAPANYTRVRYFMAYDYNINGAHFAKPYVYKESYGTSYTYDDNGNVVSAVDEANAKSTFAYDNNNQLSQLVSPSGSSYVYTYEEGTRNLTSATSTAGQTYSFEYENGNAVKATVTGEDSAASSGGKYIETSAAYTQNGNYMTSLTDAAGNTTDYTYEETRGLLTEQDDLPSSPTAYTYDSLDRVTGVSSGSSVNSYTYDSSDRLKTITSGSGSSIVRYTFGYDSFGRNTSVTVGNGSTSKTLVTNTFGIRNLLTGVAYGNGSQANYTYDNLDRLTAAGYNDVAGSYNYVYNKQGNIGLVTDGVNGINTSYTYDLAGRLAKASQRRTSGVNWLTTQYVYDEANRLTGYSREMRILGSQSFLAEFGDLTAGEDPGKVYEVWHDDVKRLGYAYDSLGRLTGRTLENGYSPYTTAYSYDDSTTGKSTARVKTIDHGSGESTRGRLRYSYFYDLKGRIATVTDLTGGTTSYAYDSLGRLVREDNPYSNQTVAYAYDARGNLTSKKSYAYTTGTLASLTPSDTVAYSYGNSTWKDQLTAYDGQSMTYDAIGNPLTYREGMTFTWQAGRQMKDVTLSSGWQYGYTYDRDGVRATKVKTYGGMEDSATSYFVENGVMVGECTVRNGSTITSKILYQFDENGQRTGFTYNGTQYYYLYNLQGDVVAITNSLAEIVAKYTYDAWGKVLSVTNASDTVQTASTFIGNINPIRYRGYYYDVETGLYYLQSRYYDPETGRFVNADGLVQTGTGLMDKNMYAYCLDDPVNNIDPTGQSCHAMDNGGYGPLCMFANGRCITHGTVDCCGSPMSLSDALDAAANMADIGNALFASGLKHTYTNSARPANIGTGLYIQQISASISKINTISKVAGYGCQALSILSLAVEVGENAGSNYIAGATYEKIAWDMNVDIVFGAGGILASVAVGGAVGSAVPVAGTVVGAASGLVVGLLYYVVTETPMVNGKSMKTWAKDSF